MKSQLIPTVFIILLVAGVMIGFTFYNIFYGAKYQSHVFTIHTIDSVRNLIENIKSYLHLSLTYSSHQALREHACQGGSVGASPWIVNGPNPVEVEFSKECLSKYTKYYFNVYFGLFNTSLPLEIYGENASVCLYDVDPNKVFSGGYDEGNFWVNCSDAKVVISGEDIKEIEGIETNDYITKNRYWYMFRNFYDWAMADVYSPCICAAVPCGCSSGSGEEFCSSCSGPVEACAKKALDDLQKRFDDNVVCKMEKMCCKQGIGPICNGECGCTGWQNMCMAKNNHECRSPEIGERSCKLSGKKILTPFTSLSSNENSNILSTYSKISLAGCVDDWECGSGGRCVNGQCIYPPVCGNGICEAGETQTNCPADCGSPPICGDRKCESGETRQNCPQDCSAICGDGICESIETPTNCCKDCGGCGGDIICKKIINGICMDAYNNQICYCRVEGRISGGYRYTCQDFKYLVPSNIGPVPLTFTVNAYAFWRDPCACCTTCECPGCGCSD